MSQSLIQKIRGLYTFPNDFSAVPEGALSVADNIIIDRDSVAEPRRGFTYLAHATARAGFPTSSDRARKIFFYDDTIVCHLKTGSVYSLVYFNPTTGFASVAALYDPPSSTVKVRAAQAKQNLYLTGALGVHRMDDRAAVPARVGVPQALDVGAITTTTSGEWLLTGNSVAYKTVWGIKDANGNLYLGAPSGRTVYTNALETPDDIATVLKIWIPTGITTNHFCQIYRTAQSTSPNDEYNLVKEVIPTSGNITAGYLSVSDLTIEALRRGDALYTNVSQQGAESANYPPPKANDIALYRDFMFYANIFEQQSITIVMSSIAAMSAGDTLIIDGDTYTLSADLDPPSWTKFTGGSDAQNTTKSITGLVEVINSRRENYYAIYLSGETDLPGKFMIRSYGVGVSAFVVTSSRPDVWIPPLPSTGPVQSSSADISFNGLACSKSLEPEHVPLSNRYFAGSKDAAILRIIALRDSLFILKEDGVYRLYGTDPSNFQIALLDSTANIISPDSAVVLNNQIFALTTQGVVAITETGVTIMSRPIEGDLLNLLQINANVLSVESFAVAYESQRAYYLFIPEVSTDTGTTQYFRYNTITSNWTRGTLAMDCGGVNPVDDRLYLGLPDKDYLYVENKSANSLDYCDYVSTNVIAAVSGVNVTIADANLLHVGQVIYQFPVLATKTGATGTAGAFDHTQDLITITAHGFSTGLIVALSISGGALPTGLVAGNYWIIKASANTFKLAASYVLAMAGTAVAFTDNGDEMRTASFVPNEKEVWGEIETLVDATHVTTKYPCQFVADAANIVNPIATKMQWVPATFGNPGINKQVREISILFSSDFYGEANVGFSTDLSPQKLYETALGSIAAPWGRFPWGGAPWGGVLRRRPLRVMVPRIHQRASFMSISFEHEVCFSPWAIQGMSYIGNNISEKVWHEGGGS